MADTAKADTLSKDVKKVRPLPPPNSDFYQMIELLNESEQAKVKQVRTFMEAAVAPVINKYWAEDSFPFDLLPGIRNLQMPAWATRAMDARVAATCWPVMCPWRLPELIALAPRSSVFTVAWPWDLSFCAAQKNRRRSGYRRWRGWRKLVPLD
jgi:hypothetical protein